MRGWYNEPPYPLLFSPLVFKHPNAIFLIWGTHFTFMLLFLTNKWIKVGIVPWPVEMFFPDIVNPWPGETPALSVQRHFNCGLFSGVAVSRKPSLRGWPAPGGFLLLLLSSLVPHVKCGSAFIGSTGFSGRAHLWLCPWVFAFSQSGAKIKAREDVIFPSVKRCTVCKILNIS